MIDPKLQALIQSVVDSADDDGCSDDLTVASKSAIEALAAFKDDPAQYRYVDLEGRACPNCGSDYLTWSGNFMSDETRVWQGVKCDNCGAKWNERSDLAGFADLEV